VASGAWDDGSCPACGGRLTAWRSVRSAEPALADRRYPLRRCAGCGTAVTGDDPETGDRGAAAAVLHETGAYRGGDPILYRLAGTALGAFDAQRLALLRKLVPPPARLLDAGAGNGRFVAAATAAGYTATGIEPSRRGIERSRGLAVTIAAETIEAAQLPDGSLDAVTLWHVLEHTDDPGAALRRIAGWLAPGGGLLVGVPNLASVQARVGADRWFHLDVPRHRTHFTPAGLDRLLRRSGLEPVSVHHRLLEHNPYGMWQSTVNRLTDQPSYLYNLLKRNAPLRARDLIVTGIGLPLVPVAAAAELLAGMAHRGGTIAVLARRP
jgi:SAM-dependent methyltransferase